MAAKPQSPFDDIAKLLAKEGVKLTKKQVLDVKRYARGVGRTNYLDRNPSKIVKPKTAAQKKVSSRLESIEDRRQDKGSRLYGDNDGPMGYFFSDKTLNKSQKKKINQGFSAEEKMGAGNARKVQKTLGTAVKKSPVKKAPAYAKRKPNKDGVSYHFEPRPKTAHAKPSVREEKPMFAKRKPNKDGVSYRFEPYVAPKRSKPKGK